MTRVAIRYGGEEYVVRDSQQDVLDRITHAVDGQVLRFQLGEHRSVHLRVGESTPIAVIVTEGSKEPLTPPRPMGLAIDPDDELGPLPNF